jgi:NodT family efflux transporter outer membrane factor (OMF) lipoprotein
VRRETMNTLHRIRRTRKIAVVGTLALMALLSGCNIGPRYKAPAPPSVTAPNYKESTVNFKDADGWKVADPQDAMIRGKWWEIFNEPELNALEEQVNTDNQNIKLSYNNLMQARALVAEARAQYWPTITIGPSWSRSRGSSNTSSSNNNSNNSGAKTNSLWSLPLDVSWTPDFWGKIRNEVRTEQYNAQASAADLELEKLTEQATLAEFYFEVRGQDKLQLILDETVASDQKALDAAQGAYDAGTGDYISVVEAQATLKAAKSSDTNVGLLRAQFEHAIAVLTGKIATDFSIPVRGMIYTPPPIPIGVPSQLAERRPDVASAERRLAAANATIGIGYGAFFPQVTISAAGGLTSSTLKHLFDWSSRVWSIGPSTSQIVFDGGLYRAQLHQYEAVYNSDLATYRQTVLTAFQQVEDALAATRVYSQQIIQQEDAVKSAQQFLDLEMQRYQSGVDPFVNVVTAQTTLQNDQVTLNSLQVSEMLSAVQLVQALGGGWDVSRLPTPTQVGAKTTAADYTMQ